MVEELHKEEEELDREPPEGQEVSRTLSLQEIFHLKAARSISWPEQVPLPKDRKHLADPSRLFASVSARLSIAFTSHEEVLSEVLRRSIPERDKRSGGC